MLLCERSMSRQSCEGVQFFADRLYNVLRLYGRGEGTVGADVVTAFPRRGLSKLVVVNQFIKKFAQVKSR